MALLLQDGGYLLLQTGGAPAGILLLRGDPGAVFHATAPSWRTANFGDGTTVVSWSSPLDPNERKIYTINATTELNGINDTIRSVDVEMSGLAILAGLRIYGVTNDETQVSIWFEINAADRSRPVWSSPGETHLITVTITSMNGHVFQRDVSLKISQL
jgi:hypothetical protein